MKKMKVLVVGSGGREHALCWALGRSDSVEKVFCAPGNPGMPPDAELLPTSQDDLEGLARAAESLDVSLTVVGPEAPLNDGIADLFASRGLAVFGPSLKAARLEGSKVFAKEFMASSKVPTAPFEVFDALEPALAHVRSRSVPQVIKTDGLAAGKGVMVCDDADQAEEALQRIMGQRSFGAAGDRVVIEDRLQGEEVSFMVICDGKNVLPLASSQDHKRLRDKDEGPNTGGMGAYSPAPALTFELQERVLETCILPVVRGMAVRGTPYRGVLYAGLMITREGPMVLEYNCRFGDPEAQPVLMRLAKGDLASILLAAAHGELAGFEIEYDPRPAVCVVMASSGYPGAYEKGKVISGLDKAARNESTKIFMAGVDRKPGFEEIFVTSGGRVLGVTALGQDLKEAQQRAYDAVGLIHWDKVHFRTDIASRGLHR